MSQTNCISIKYDIINQKKKRTCKTMIITRKIPNSNEEMEITLTSAELSNAYYEQEHEFDKKDIINEIENEDFETDYKCSAETAMKYVDEMAYRKRKYIDDYDAHWSDAVEDAIKDVLNEKLNTKNED